jgi:hypothetical protein
MTYGMPGESSGSDSDIITVPDDNDPDAAGGDTVYGQPGYISGTVDSDDAYGGTDVSGLWIPYWMRGTQFEQIYKAEWIESGSTSLALDAVRNSPLYDQTFPGNKRDDGSYRMDEGTYLSTIEGYEDAFESVGLSAEWFKRHSGGFVALIEGNVSADELFTTRLMPVYEDVILGGDYVRAEYAEMWGIDLTDQAIMASILDPDGIGTGILNHSIAQAEVAGMAARSGYDISDEFRDLLLNEGELTRETADDLFTSAKGLLPVLEILRRRHSDSEDEFDIEEFAGASVFRDPQEAMRMRAMLRSERASFQSNSSLINRQDDMGRMIGLEAL